MAKVLLIAPSLKISRKVFDPHNWYPPLSICYLSSVLKNCGHDVNILDTLLLYLNYPEIDPIDFENAATVIVQKIDYDFIGISVNSHTRIIAHNISKIIKTISPNTIIVWGGPYPSTMHKLLSQRYQSLIDAIVIGEGENLIVEVIKHFSQVKSYNRINKNHIELFSSSKEKDVTFTFGTDTLPDYSAYESSHFIIQNASVVGSRGCPFNCCDFCSSRWIPFRERTGADIMQEIDQLCTKYKMSNIHFHDNTFTTNRKRTLELFKEINYRSYHINFSMKTRFDYIDKQLISMFKRMGGTTISFGLETGNPILRKTLGKDISNSRIKYITLMLRDFGLRFGVYVLLGHPEESEQDIKQTIDFLQEIHPDEVITSIVCLYPGAALYHRALAEGKIKEEDWLSEKICFTYANEDEKIKLFEYEDIINRMFPRYNEWSEYCGLYNMRE